MEILGHLILLNGNQAIQTAHLTPEENLIIAIANEEYREEIVLDAGAAYGLYRYLKEQYKGIPDSLDEHA